MSAFIFKGVSIYSLIAFRITFGILCIFQLIDFKNYSSTLAINENRIPFDFFEWLPLLSFSTYQLIYNIAIVAAICFTIGLLYRLSIIIVFIALANIVILHIGFYNNHYYFFAMLAFLFIWVDGNSNFSIDNIVFKPVKHFVPNWQIFIFILSVIILYFYGAIAKINYDWLIRAEPVLSWLPKMFGTSILNLTASQQFIIAASIAWSGFLIDLIFPFLLLNKRYRLFATLSFIGFHIANLFLFSIGLFPFLSIAILILFWNDKFEVVINQKTSKRKFRANKFIFSTLFCFFVLQLFIPLRHHLFPGNYKWTGAGYLFAWTMKLTDINPIIRFEAELESGQILDVDYNALTNFNQRDENFIMSNVFTTVWFAKHLEHKIKLRHPKFSNEDIKIRCDSYISINNRPFQRKINPNIDLTNLDLEPINKYFQKHDWIIPLGNDTLIDKKLLNEILEN